MGIFQITVLIHLIVATDSDKSLVLQEYPMDLSILFLTTKTSQKNMGLIKRYSGDRRWGLPVDMPLTDGDGVCLVHDQRSGQDRRKSIASFEELMVLFSQLPPGNPHQD